jgi:hypothetical protein
MTYRVDSLSKENYRISEKKIIISLKLLYRWQNFLSLRNT